MTVIATWIALGAAIGLVAAIRSPERFPAGWAGAIAAGAAGAFVGGGLVTIYASRGMGGVDLDRLAAGGVAAVVVVAALRQAQVAEPRAQ
jgi:uncharacterized membrane protein YeaQ/YmgE (transglycosylase-associated protein family)